MSLKKIICYFALFIAIIHCNAFATPIQRIPIFLVADDNYAPYVATTMASVLKNTKSHIDFYILSNGISSENQRKIKNTKKFFPNNSFSVKIVEIDMKKFSKFNEGFGFITKTAYTKWLIPEIDKNLSKAVYLDCDIIVQGDIAKLYNEDLQENIVGVIPDMTDIVFGKTRHELLKKYGKFKNDIVWNSGVILIDCEKWRKHNITKKLIVQKNKILEYHRQHNIPLGSADQDTYNVVLQDFKKLDFKYNTHSIAVEQCKKEDNCKILFNNNANDLLKKSIIIHFDSKGQKPWIKPVLYGEKFWQIVSYTDFADKIKEYYNNSRLSSIKDDIQHIKNDIQYIKDELQSYKNDNNKNIKTIKKKVVIIYILLGFCVLFNIAILLFIIRNSRKKQN